MSALQLARHLCLRCLKFPFLHAFSHVAWFACWGCFSIFPVCLSSECCLAGAGYAARHLTLHVLVCYVGVVETLCSLASNVVLLVAKL